MTIPGKIAILGSLEPASEGLLSPLGLDVWSLNPPNLTRAHFQKVSYGTSRFGVHARTHSSLLPGGSYGPTHRFPSLRANILRVFLARALLRHPAPGFKGKILIYTFQAPTLQIRIGAVSYRHRHPTRGAKPRLDRLS